MTNKAAGLANEMADPNHTAAFRRIKVLVGVYAVISVLTFAGLVAYRNSSSVTQPVWIRVSIVAASSLILFALTLRAARGSRGAFRRLRVLSAVMLAAIVVIVSLPGMFPVWMRIEQAVCGLLLLGVVVVANGRGLRARFAK
ncbi:hypothetical protein DZF91_31455 [Actinomadura logoneensis]|uniref:Uncharacterized protein n=1 Tax=Actinomadura logoneensis TaxID=2293572 RepID=A0A372JE94_9ACTN|nr:hypothetical protein [Actinomadura logoneensis]RFU37708.1 hypothetical protein DZF91_31455 [Actinomadura logoneensis]